MKSIQLLLLLALMFIITACSGGGSSPAPAGAVSGVELPAQVSAVTAKQ
jgi:hypothetical protein